MPTSLLEGRSNHTLECMAKKWYDFRAFSKPKYDQLLRNLVWFAVFPREGSLKPRHYNEPARRV